MSVCAPANPTPLTAEQYAAELRAAVDYVVGRIAAAEGVPSCTGLDGDALAALLAYQVHPSRDALARAYRAAERQVGGHPHD